MVTIDKKESDFLNSLKFVCILTIVMVHCSLHDSNYITPRLVQELIPDIRSWTCALHFGEVALGLFFVVSGYLFFRSSQIDSFNWKKDYLSKVKSRFKGLFILYVVWNTVGLIVGYLINKNYPSDLLALLNGYNPFTPKQYFGRGLWFLESLIVFTLLSPLYYFAIRHLKHLVPLLCLFFCLTDMEIGFLYFNVYLLLGCYFSCMGIRLIDIAKLFNWKICLLLIVLLQLVLRSGMVSVPIAGSVSIFIFLSAFMGILYNNPVPAKIAGSSTFIYVAHFYSTMIWKRVLLPLLPADMFGYVANMVLNWAITSCICVLVYLFIIRKFDIMNLLFAGGRTIKKLPEIQNSPS